MMSNYTTGTRRAGTVVTLTLGTFFLASLYSAYAGSISYGDFSDIPPGTLMYLDVEESSGTDPVPPALYGPPSITADQLDFNPPGFVATSTGGPLDVTDGQLNFTVMAAPGEGFNSVRVIEGGDYSFSGVGGVGTSVSAALSVRVEITEIDNTPLLVPIVLIGTDFFSSDYASEGGSDTGLLDWSLGAIADLSPVLGGATLGATKADVVINNQLVSNSEADSLAFIAKKDFKVNPLIPEPTSLALFGLGSLLLTCRRR